MSSGLLRSYKGLKLLKDQKTAQDEKSLLRSYKGLKQAFFNDLWGIRVMFITFL